MTSSELEERLIDSILNHGIKEANELISIFTATIKSSSKAIS